MVSLQSRGKLKPASKPQQKHASQDENVVTPWDTSHVVLSTPRLVQEGGACLDRHGIVLGECLPSSQGVGLCWRSSDTQGYQGMPSSWFDWLGPGQTSE